MQPTLIEWIATVLFILAIIHVFFVSRFRHIGNSFPQGSLGENVFHLLGETEFVFGLWAAVFLASVALVSGAGPAIRYAESLNFTEPLFVFVIMAVTATRPVISLARAFIFGIANRIPTSIVGQELAIYGACLSIGPLLGSFITEPAAMTVTALILKKRYFESGGRSEGFKYATLATLLVNVSIGGVLTPYAAPPVLMVAAKWNWDLQFMLQSFGWKSTLAVLVNATIACWFLRRELRGMRILAESRFEGVPLWVSAAHLLFVGLVVASAHHPVIFIGLFLLFLGFVAVTSEYQEELALKQSLLVALFLAGLVVLGGKQSWWLQPLLENMPVTALYLATAALTAIADNAALTYLGSQIEGISDAFKMALMGGAIAGGGLTVIANAPNPAGFSILQSGFGPDGIRPLKLLLFALVPTAISILFFWPF